MSYIARLTSRALDRLQRLRTVEYYSKEGKDTTYLNRRLYQMSKQPLLAAKTLLIRRPRNVTSVSLNVIRVFSKDKKRLFFISNLFSTILFLTTHSSEQNRFNHRYLPDEAKQFLIFYNFIGKNPTF